VTGGANGVLSSGSVFFLSLRNGCQESEPRFTLSTDALGGRYYKHRGLLRLVGNSL